MYTPGISALRGQRQEKELHGELEDCPSYTRPYLKTNTREHHHYANNALIFVYRRLSATWILS